MDDRFRATSVCALGKVVAIGLMDRPQACRRKRCLMQADESEPSKGNILLLSSHPHHWTRP